jgi:hypothetical protein
VSSLISIQAALYLHLRILWLLLLPNAVPQLPSRDSLAAFKSRYTSDTQILAAREGPTLISEASVRVARLSQLPNAGKHATDAALVEAFVIDYIATYCAKFGLTEWAPDLRDTPYSLYNSAHRIIAIDTFRQAMAARAYSHMGPNQDFLHDTALLMRVYDHFVHHFQLQRFKKEGKIPGSVALIEQLRPTYTRRGRVCTSLCGDFVY